MRHQTLCSINLSCPCDHLPSASSAGLLNIRFRFLVFESMDMFGQVVLYQAQLMDAVLENSQNPAKWRLSRAYTAALVGLQQSEERCVSVCCCVLCNACSRTTCIADLRPQGAPRALGSVIHSFPGRHRCIQQAAFKES